jgi:hypothetical protein
MVNVIIWAVAIVFASCPVFVGVYAIGTLLRERVFARREQTRAVRAWRERQQVS